MAKYPQLYYKNGSSWQSALLNSYPVGAIYMSSSGTSPADLFGGTWEQIKDARFWQPNTWYGGTGGEATHKLSGEEIPVHAHALPIKSSGEEATGWGLVRSGGFGDRVIVNQGIMKSSNVGSSQAHNNTPLYRTCFCWRRTG